MVFFFFFKVINLTFRNCSIPGVSFKGGGAHLDSSVFPSHAHFVVLDLGPVTVRAPLVVNLQKATRYAGFYVLYLFHCSIAGVDAYLKGNDRRWCQLMGGPSPLISQSGERGPQLHNNLLSSSGGSVYLTKSSRGVGFILCFVVFFSVIS